MVVKESRREEGANYFGLDCRIFDRSGRGRERRPLGEGGLRRQSRRGRCMGGLASLSISGVKRPIFTYKAYGSLERLPAL